MLNLGSSNRQRNERLKMIFAVFILLIISNALTLKLFCQNDGGTGSAEEDVDDISIVPPSILEGGNAEEYYQLLYNETFIDSDVTFDRCKMLICDFSELEVDSMSLSIESSFNNSTIAISRWKTSSSNMSLIASYEDVSVLDKTVGIEGGNKYGIFVFYYGTNYVDIEVMAFG